MLCDLLLNFGTFVLSLDRPQLQMSNFADGLTVRDIEQKIKNGPKRGVARSHDLLLNFGTPLLSLDRLKLQTSNLQAD